MRFRESMGRIIDSMERKKPIISRTKAPAGFGKPDLTDAVASAHSPATAARRWALAEQ